MSLLCKYQPISSSFPMPPYEPVVPARQAYSHCASVDSATFLPVFFESH